MTVDINKLKKSKFNMWDKVFMNVEHTLNKGTEKEEKVTEILEWQILWINLEDPLAKKINYIYWVWFPTIKKTLWIVDQQFVYDNKEELIKVENEKLDWYIKNLEEKKKLLK